jgi:hypothetical protein
MPSRTKLLAGAIAYGLLVFAGTALLGFVVAPAIGVATGLFPIEQEAAGYFSFLTLKAAPLLAGLSAGAARSQEWLAGFSIPSRIAVYAATVLLVWITGATIAAIVLG